MLKVFQRFADETAAQFEDKVNAFIEQCKEAGLECQATFVPDPTATTLACHVGKIEIQGQDPRTGQTMKALVDQSRAQVQEALERAEKRKKDGGPLRLAGR